MTGQPFLSRVRDVIVELTRGPGRKGSSHKRVPPCDGVDTGTVLLSTFCADDAGDTTPANRNIAEVYELPATFVLAKTAIADASTGSSIVVYNQLGQKIKGEISAVGAMLLPDGATMDDDYVPSGTTAPELTIGADKTIKVEAQVGETNGDRWVYELFNGQKVYAQWKGASGEWTVWVV